MHLINYSWRRRFLNVLQLLTIITLEMDWNEYSDDSWMENASDSDSNQNTKKESASQISASTHSQDNNQKQSTSQAVHSTQSHAQKSQQQNQKKQIDRNYKKKQSVKFLSDQEVLQQYQTGKVEDQRKIKVVNCNQKQQKTILEDRDKKKLLRVRQYKPNCYVVTCWNKEDLVKFIKQKIEKKYKFKIGLYVPSAKEKQMKALRQKQRQQKQKQRMEKKGKQENQTKDHRNERQLKEKSKLEYKAKQDEGNTKQHRKQYRREKDDEQGRKQKNQRQRQSRYRDKDDQKQLRNKDSKVEQLKDNREKQSKIKKEYSKDQQRKYKQKKGNQQHGQDKKQKRVKVQNKDVQRQGKSSIIAIKTSQIPPQDVAEWIKQNKFDKQFNAITLIAKGNLYQYAQKLCEQIFKTLKFGLSCQIIQEECLQRPEQLFRFVLKEGVNPLPIKKNIKAVYISKCSASDFEQVEKFNIHVIGNKKNLEEETDFDDKEYFELFKKNYQRIVGKWSKWILYAYGKNITKMLRLSGDIKKKLSKNEFNYEVGVEGRVPFIRFEICDLNKTKFKVDTSVINSHLQDS